MTYRIRISGWDEKASKIQRIENTIKEFTEKSKVYKINREFNSSGHKEGSGGGSLTTLTVSKDEEPSLIVEIKDSYYTTSGDLFDYPIDSEISVELKDKNLTRLFESLKKYMDEIKKELIV